MRINAKLGGGAAALLIALSLPARAAQQPPAPQTPPPQPAAAAQAPAAAAAEAIPSCGTCHDQAKQFVTNPHARGAVVKGEVPNDVCTMCHGDGAEHIAAGGDKSKISVPRGREGADNTCMLCHDMTTDKVSRRGGMHANSAAVNCLSCHKIHNTNPKLVAGLQLTVCGTCHTQA